MLRSGYIAVAAALALGACNAPPGKPAKPKVDPNLVYKGSYAQSCRDIVAADGYLSANCMGSGSRPTPTRIQASLCKGDIGNAAGVLTCNGAVAIIPAPKAP